MKNKTLLAELRIHESRPSVKKYITLMEAYFSEKFSETFVNYLERKPEEEVKLDLEQISKILGNDWVLRNFF